MSDFQAWIGNCHLRATEGDGEYRCQAAVWARDYSSFRSALETHIAYLDYSILWLEEVLSAPEYLSRHSAQQRQVGALAQAVHAGHTVELGPIEGTITETTKSYLTVENHTFEHPLHQTDMPFRDQEWIAPKLKELLFNQPKNGSKIYTYLVVDATLRKNITGVFDLDSIDVPIRSLFKGKAAQELKESAPYLIDMTLPDTAWTNNEDVPTFHRDFFRKHWGQNTGIFIRTTASMDHVWGHFRKFIRLQREDTKAWIFLRFWDPRVAISYFSHIADWCERCTAWFHPRNAPGIKGLIVEARDGSTAYNIVPDIPISSKISIFPNQILSMREIEAFENNQTVKFDEKIALQLLKQDPIWLSRFNATKDAIISFVAKVRYQAQKEGYTTERGIATLCYASLYLGIHFEEDHRFNKKTREILMKEKYSESEKKEKIIELLDRKKKENFFSDNSIEKKIKEILSFIETENDISPADKTASYMRKIEDIESFKKKSLSCFDFKNQTTPKKINTVIKISLLLGMYWGENPIYHELKLAILSNNWRVDVARSLRRIIETKQTERENVLWA
ncbi:DUF4123 domain-containing protein [Thalassospira sp. TSL5-1]|uniref:DUF4123 domain-containing protein n=1 Tax=Thalassospira sp. TSL5-1 TaxID=1544451 RepID=UPI00093D180A|nr:DUF4123 domain-containing protein [Thalassospira sp. TSL5-1]OKH89426.1 hypothetical protein LF95_05430 [Thalassospira sp. TSL5-1]